MPRLIPQISTLIHPSPSAGLCQRHSLSRHHFEEAASVKQRTLTWRQTLAWNEGRRSRWTYSVDEFLRDAFFRVFFNRQRLDIILFPICKHLPRYSHKRFWLAPHIENRLCSHPHTRPGKSRTWPRTPPQFARYKANVERWSNIIGGQCWMCAGDRRRSASGREEDEGSLSCCSFQRR